MRALGFELSTPNHLQDHVHILARMSQLRTLAFRFSGPLYIGPLDALFGNSEFIRTVYFIFEPCLRPDVSIPAYFLRSLQDGFFPCMPSVLTVVVRIPEGNTITVRC